MSENILLKIQRTQATTARETIEGWLATRPDLTAHLELADLVHAFLDTPEQMQQARDRTFDHLLDNQAESDALMEDLRRLFEESAALLGTLRRLVDDAERMGHHLPESAELDKAIERLAALRAETFAHWERYTLRDEQQAKGEIQRGELLDLDEALPQAAGVDKQAWIRHIDERRRNRT